LNPAYLLATDLDGTVIPLEWNAEREREIAAFAELVAAHQQLSLAYVTGRYLTSAVEGVRRAKLPAPAVFACDVGTSVYRRSPAGEYVADESYAQEMQRAFGDHDGRDILAALTDTEHLRPQESEKQTRYKVSFYLETSADDAAVLHEMRERLGAIGAANNLIHSVDPVTGTGLVDVLPADVSKASAVGYLQRSLALPDDAVVYAGDSGNDLDALVSGVNAVVVGNAPAAVRAEVERRAAAAGKQARVYLAEQPYAAGVVEGCRHFGML
jgi:sucrose-6F-phosphate phosphohydrolase